MTDGGGRPIPVHLKRATRTQVLERIAEQARDLFAVWEQVLEDGTTPAGLEEVNLRIAKLGMTVLVVLDATPADEEVS